MAARKYINAATAAVTSEAFQIRVSDVPASITAKGLGVGETVDLQITQDDGATWFDAYAAGSKVSLTSTANQTIVAGPGTFRFNKGITAGAVTAALHTDRLGL